MAYLTNFEIASIIIIAVISISLYKLHKKPDNSFNLLDLLMENGRISKIAAVFMGTWAAMTFVFIGMYLNNKMTEGLYVAYGGACFAPLIVRMFATNNPSTTSSITSSTKVQETVVTKD